MPRLSVWMTRTALLHLAVGFALGALLLVQRELPLPAGVARLRPVHAELVRVDPAEHLWAAAYDRDLGDVLGL